MKQLVFFLAFILFSIHVQAKDSCKLSGKVIKVADGDTITILDSKKKQHKTRLAGIDAPERKEQEKSQ